MPTLPNIRRPNIAKTDVEHATLGPRRRPAPSPPSPASPASPPMITPSRAARAKLKREVLTVQKKVELAAKTFYEVGAQLNTWKKTRSWQALSSGGLSSGGVSDASFKAFVSAHVMPYSSGARLMTIAAEYPKTAAAKLGIEKGFQLARYAKRTNTQALALVRRGARLGSPPKRVSELSAKEIE